MHAASMTEPLVSVFIITYNHRDFIEQSIRSAADQDYANLEVIVADDGSSDGTDEIVLRVAADYPPGRVVPIVGEGHLGIPGNCNRVLARVRGKYLAMSAGDDMMLPGRVRRQVAWMEEDENRVVCGHDVEIFRSETNESLGLFSDMMRFRSGKGGAFFVEHGLPVPPVSIMYRVSALPKSGYDTRLPILADWKFAIDIVAGGGSYGFIDGVYARYRRHGTSVLTMAFEPRYSDALLTLALVESEYPHLLASAARARRIWFLRWAISLEKRGRRSEARKYLRQAFGGRMRFHWKFYAVLLLTCMPGSWSRAIISRNRIFPW